MARPYLLLAEDNPDDAELTRRSFRKANTQGDIVVVADGAETLDYLFARGAYADRDPQRLPSLILLDLKLPRVDGLEVLRQVRAAPLTARVPVVILTSSREERDVVRAYELGANSYVCKRIAVGELADAVSHLVRYWMLLNETPQMP